MLKRTSLYDIHKKLGARMVEFGGWEMPVQYTGVIAEHRAVRSQVGLFDVSHMGQIFVTGMKAQAFINLITTHDIKKISNGCCQYSVCCYESGGCVDDVITYQLNPERYLMVVNASNTEKDFAWFQKNRVDDVSIENKSDHFSLLALQGPLAVKVLKPLVKFDLDSLKPFSFRQLLLDGREVLISRTGYTGEDGFEILGPWDLGPYLWNLLMASGTQWGIQPIGLGARDTLRMEVAYSLYGHEISESINPLEARLGWIVKLDKTNFIGKKALETVKKSGISRTLVGLEMVDTGIPRQGFKVFDGLREVGLITSGTFSPSLKKAIGLALVDRGLGNQTTDLAVEIRGRRQSCRMVDLPFYKGQAHH